MATVNQIGATSRGLVVVPITPGTVSIIDLEPGMVVGSAQIETETAFDGVPSIQLGVVGDLGKILSASEVKLGVLGKYLSTALHRFSTSTTLTLTFSAGGSTVGQARLTVQITRES